MEKKDGLGLNCYLDLQKNSYREVFRKVPIEFENCGIMF